MTSMVYFGLALNVGKLAGSTHLNLFIAGALELTKDILLYPLVRYMGRRLPTAGSMVGAGLCLLVTLAIPAGKIYNCCVYFLIRTNGSSCGRADSVNAWIRTPQVPSLRSGWYGTFYRASD